MMSDFRGLLLKDSPSSEQLQNRNSWIFFYDGSTRYRDRVVWDLIYFKFQLIYVQKIGFRKSFFRR